MDNKELYDKLCMLQLNELIRLLETGEATPQHHAVIRGILKDQGIMVNREHKEGDPLAKLLDQINEAD